MKTVFIAGSRGYIGKNLVEGLKNKYKLLTPSRNELDLTNPITTDAFFKNHTIDVVVNCAVVGGARPERLKNSVLLENLLPFYNILKNKDKYKKLIHFGSGAEYDKREPIIRVKESNFGKKVPLDDYGLYKYICSKIIGKENNVVALRIFGLYGKYEDVNYRFVSNAITNNLKGLPITINQNVFFDYMYIDDFVKIVDYFIAHKAKEKFYNIGTGNKVDLVTIAKIVNDIARRKSKITIKQKGLANEYTCDNHRLMNELKGMHFTDMREGIQRLYAWYEKQLNS